MLSLHVRDADEKKQSLQRALVAQAARGRELSGALSARAEGAANGAVNEAYALQRAIERETRLLAAESAAAGRRAARFADHARGLGAALKELGDLAHWAGTLEAAVGEVAALAAGASRSAGRADAARE